MCAWLAEGIHEALRERLREAPLLDRHSLLDGLESLGIGHLYTPLDPFLDEHTTGAVAPDTGAAGRLGGGSRRRSLRAMRIASAIPVLPLALATPLDYLILGRPIEHLAAQLSADALTRVAASRRDALRRRADAALRREVSAPPRLRRLRPGPSRGPPADAPRFVLAPLDTVRPGTGATRRARFRF